MRVRPAFSEDEVEFVTALAEQGGVAIENACFSLYGWGRPPVA